MTSFHFVTFVIICLLFDIDAFMYVFANAGMGKTGEDNRTELDRWKIIPRMLRNVTVRNIQV